MIPSIAIIALLIVILMAWFDYYTSKESDREIEKFFRGDE